MPFYKKFQIFAFLFSLIVCIACYFTTGIDGWFMFNFGLFIINTVILIVT